MTMKRDPLQPIDLETAQGVILRSAKTLPEEEVSLFDSVGRFPLRSLKALEPLPGYDQSLRDGFAVSSLEEKSTLPEECVFRVVDEVAAGDTREIVLQRGEAVRIMTGGLLPSGSQAVVPQELCRLEGERLRVPAAALSPKGRFIRGRGSEFAKGALLAAKGVVLTPESQILLAGAGYESVPVARKVRVAFFCTGSELVSSQAAAGDGRKISANSFLLHSLIRQSGCQLIDQQTVADDPRAVVRILEEFGQGACDILISTGGMGPGKFDLIEDTFSSVGGRTMYRSLHLRPGKSTLFGSLGDTLFFGLPGPPPAVHFLFNALVRPAILGLQGARKWRPGKVRATLTREMRLPKGDLPRLKGASLYCEDGRCLVRPTGKGEPVNCYIYCPARRRRLSAGEKVTLHLTTPLPYSG